MKQEPVGNRDDVRENRIYITFFQTMLPVVVGVNGIAVLFTPLPDGQTAFGLLFTKDSPLVKFGLLLFFSSVHEKLLV